MIFASYFCMQFRDLEIEAIRKRVRALRISVKPDGRLVLTIPERMSDAIVVTFLESHYNWMVRTQQKVLDRVEAQQKLTYSSGEDHLLWGKYLPLRVEPERGRESVAFYDDEIVLYAHPDRTPAERRKLLYQGYYQQFKPVLDALLKKWTDITGNEVKDLSIRLMRTEWGSNTPLKHRMTFNVDLARMPIECVEYVVIHEFTHFEHCDHSPAFWALCDKRLASMHLADSKQQRARMKKLTRCGGEF